MVIGAPILKLIRVYPNVLKNWDTKNINFPFGTNGKLMVIGAPILKHIRVYFFAKLFQFWRFKVADSNFFLRILC